MVTVGSITYSHDPGEESERWSRAVTRGMKAAAIYWRMNYAKKHFTPSGGREYEYVNRSRAYMIRKAWKKGHQNPLEWSGTLRTMVLGQFPVPRIKVGNGKAVATMALRVPAYTYYTRTKSGTAQPPKYDELVITSPAEAKELMRVMSEITEHEMTRRAGRPKRVQVA